MTKAVIFRTPGLIPIEAFTMFGVNAKPNSSNPIGFFGTGLKYAVAVLLRHGINLRVFIGPTEYEFYSKRADFRGTDFDYVIMRKRNSMFKKWTSTTLSFTTLHGKTWELWQALRELESNTRDEGGESTVDDHWGFVPAPGESLIVIESDEFARVYEEQLDHIFLPIKSLTLRDASKTLEVYNQPSKYIYYRGLRVYDLETPTMYTYNFLQKMDLTEDRTLKYVFEARAAIARHVSRSKDEKLIHSIVGAEEKFFEHKIDYDFVYDAPSEEFMNVIKTRRRRNLPVSSYAGGFYSKYSPPDRKPLKEMTIVEQWQWWLDSGKINDEELRALIVKTIDKLGGPTVQVTVVPEFSDEVPF